MCISNQRECIKNNPPLVCCAVNVIAFVVVLFTAGIYIVHFPVQNIDDVWHLKDVLKNSTGDLNATYASEIHDQLNNVTDITETRAIRTEQRIQVLAIFCILVLAIILIYGCFPRKEFNDKKRVETHHSASARI
jgi:hypothetical protein